MANLYLLSLDGHSEDDIVSCQLRKLLTLEIKSVKPLRGLKEKISGAGNCVHSIRMD